MPAIKFGRRITRNFNSLIGRYPGADGMKTGFICASGFNLVASATRNGKRMIAVVLGAPSSPVRAAKAAQLLERGFTRTSGLSWLQPTLGTLASMEPIAAEPPNLRDDMCGPKRKRPGIQSDDDNVAIASSGTSENGDAGFSLFSTAAASGSLKPSEMLALPAAAAEPMVVYTGPKRSGAALVAAVAADEASQTVRGKRRARASRASPCGSRPSPIRRPTPSPRPSRRRSRPPRSRLRRSRPQRTPPTRSPRAKPVAGRRQEGRRQGREDRAAAKPKPAAKDSKN